MGGLDRQVAVQVQRDAVLGNQIVGEQLALALHEHQAALLEAEAERLEDLAGFVRDLRPIFSVIFSEKGKKEVFFFFFTWMQPTFPVLSILDATFTVFPQMS